MVRELILNCFLCLYPLDILDIRSLLVCMSIAKNSEGKTEELSEKNGESRPIGRNSKQFFSPLALSEKKPCVYWSD
jgi:hypothetical protein